MSRGGLKMSRGWGFKIDYTRAIADDEARIKWAELSIARGWYRRSWPYADPTLGTYETTELWQLILYCADVAAASGYSPQDRADLAEAMDLDMRGEAVRRLAGDLPEPQPGIIGIQRGEAIAAELTQLGGGWVFRDEAEARSELRRARASRARHIRNRAKYERTPSLAEHKGSRG